MSESSCFANLLLCWLSIFIPFIPETCTCGPSALHLALLWLLGPGESKDNHIVQVCDKNEKGTSTHPQRPLGGSQVSSYCLILIAWVRGGAGKRILVGQSLNTKLVPGGALLHKSTNGSCHTCHTAGALTGHSSFEIILRSFCSHAKNAIKIMAYIGLLYRNMCWKCT